MTNRNRILGRPRAGEQLSRAEIAALEKYAARPKPQKPPVNRENVKVRPQQSSGGGPWSVEVWIQGLRAG
jgi:hypothetical protein